MTDITCSIPGCERRSKSRGWCKPHYDRWHKYGDLQTRPSIRRKRVNGLSLEEAFRNFMPGEPPPPGTVWPWTGYVADGYGRPRFGDRAMLAHRVAYEVFRGPIPKGQVVRHMNDTPIDVNPWNLELGTAPDNVHDMDKRGRRASALTEADVREIRRSYAAGEATQKALGDRYGVVPSTISHVVHRKTWEHI